MLSPRRGEWTSIALYKSCASAARESASKSWRNPRHTPLASPRHTYTGHVYPPCVCGYVYVHKCHALTTLDYNRTCYTMPLIINFVTKTLPHVRTSGVRFHNAYWDKWQVMSRTVLDLSPGNYSKTMKCCSAISCNYNTCTHLHMLCLARLHSLMALHVLEEFISG